MSDSADEEESVLQTLVEQTRSKSELVQNVLSQVYTEFATWNVAYCRQVLTSFRASFNWQSYRHPDFRSPSISSTPATFNPSPVASETKALVSQQVYSPDGIIETSSMTLEVVHIASSINPYPPYESCSPLHRNVFKGDDSDNMDFIPYADDQTFDHTRHTHHYGSFSWQDAFDPDLEVIVLEAVYRLKTSYALTYDEIEDSNVLPLKLYSQPGKFGMLSTSRRRDRLHWSGNSIPTSFTFPPSTLPQESDLRSRLKTLNSLFCPNLNCVEPLCSVHVEPNPIPPKAQRPSSHMREVTSACRNQCFINNKLEETSPFWDETDLDTFKVISEISPNVIPCDLAELCFKPCFEVFYYWKLLYPGNFDEAQPPDVINQRRNLTFNDIKPTHFTPNDPCQHSGPCDSSSDCPCFENESHCQRNCRCSLECNRRWQGCRCSRGRSRWSCVTDRCPCVEARRECDPELCADCRCTILADDTLCCNSQIQRGARKELEVKRSRWGLGTFLAEPAKAGDLIAEYNGEMIYEPTVESRADLASHRNRCYVFDLNNTFSLDSTYAGNISRFIDHADAERSRRLNSQARVRLVNGDHRIGIFAMRDMEAGSQVLMNYGSMFFIK